MMKTMFIAKDVYTYAQEGIENKIKNGWFEEPPQMENRIGIIKGSEWVGRGDRFCCPSVPYILLLKNTSRSISENPCFL